MEHYLKVLVEHHLEESCRLLLSVKRINVPTNLRNFLSFELFFILTGMFLYLRWEQKITFNYKNLKRPKCTQHVILGVMGVINGPWRAVHWKNLCLWDVLRQHRVHCVVFEQPHQWCIYNVWIDTERIKYNIWCRMFIWSVLDVLLWRRVSYWCTMIILSLAVALWESIWLAQSPKSTDPIFYSDERLNSPHVAFKIWN